MRRLVEFERSDSAGISFPGTNAALPKGCGGNYDTVCVIVSVKGPVRCQQVHQRLFLFLVNVVVSGVFFSTKTRRDHKFHGSVAAGSRSE